MNGTIQGAPDTPVAYLDGTLLMLKRREGSVFQLERSRDPHLGAAGEPSTEASLLEQLAAEYEMMKADCADQVRTFLAALRDRDLLHRCRLSPHRAAAHRSPCRMGGSVSDLARPISLGFSTDRGRHAPDLRDTTSRRRTSPGRDPSPDARCPFILRSKNRSKATHQRVRRARRPGFPLHRNPDEEPADLRQGPDGTWLAADVRLDGPRELADTQALYRGTD